MHLIDLNGDGSTDPMTDDDRRFIETAESQNMLAYHVAVVGNAICDQPTIGWFRVMASSPENVVEHLFAFGSHPKFGKITKDNIDLFYMMSRNSQGVFSPQIVRHQRDDFKAPNEVSPDSLDRT